MTIMKREFNKVIAAYTIINNASLNIWEIEYGIDDYVWAGINDSKPRRYKLYSTSKGYYFNFGGSRYYTDEFVSV